MADKKGREPVGTSDCLPVRQPWGRCTVSGWILFLRGNRVSVREVFPIFTLQTLASFELCTVVPKTWVCIIIGVRPVGRPASRRSKNCNVSFVWEAMNVRIVKARTVVVYLVSFAKLDLFQFDTSIKRFKMKVSFLGKVRTRSSLKSAWLLNTFVWRNMLTVI